MDVATANWMLAHRDPLLTRICDAAMWVGTTFSGMAVCILLIYLASVLRRRRIVTLGCIASVLVATGLTLILKALIGRPRPGAAYAMVATSGSSMPSTAAAMTTAGLVVLLLLAPRGQARMITGAALLAVDLLVGFAVIYLGAHWLTDVLAGMALGALVGGPALWATSRVLPRGGRANDPTEP